MTKLWSILFCVGGLLMAANAADTVETKLDDHAVSFLPAGKKWKLAWHDEFDGSELDRTKWGFRLNFWGKRFPAYSEEGVEVKDGTIRLNLVKLPDGNFCSPHLQTGSLTYDIPKDTDGSWPFGEMEPPKFMHRYGYYEVRCRLPKNPGWHAAFWLQSPSVGAHPDARRAGVECDIMENYRQHIDNLMIAGNLWGGYGKSGRVSTHFAWEFKETKDGWHYYGVNWQPGGYTFYADGEIVGTVLPPEMKHLEEQSVFKMNGRRWAKKGSVRIGPVSQVEQFILLSTECHGYRGPGFSAPKGHPAGTHAPLLDEAVLPDYFEVDHVRVFDLLPE